MEHNVLADIRKSHIDSIFSGLGREAGGQAQGIIHRWLVVISVTEHLKQVDHL